ncbi:hypothetical protein UFOVP1355_38 [uncultured Caudovirales phage]|uniref:Uncharacterized protein n=1 Tax=uncultured Caudovirales phage TaxID=2100421 RepID=A0A6J5S3I5_9CAUD|nr:hypothetical protein UFOVP1355_38 [uncultured Caudovirales phage]
MSIELVRRLPYDHPYRWDGTLFGSPKLWQPSQIATDLWLDAEDTSTITLNGSTVSQWNDKSGNNRNAVQATAVNQPTYNTTGLNGKPALDTSAGSRAMRSSFGSTITVDAINVFVVFKATAIVGGAQLFDVRNSANGLPLFDDSASTGFGARVRNDSSVLTGLTSFGSNTTNNNLSSYSFQNGLIENRLNGVGRTASASGSVTCDRIGIFGSGISAPSATSAQAVLGEMVVVLSTVSATDTQRVEGYLAWKWGLEANLPVDHPYKNAPPTA